MIYDNIKYIESYTGISEGVRLGLEFLRELDPNTEVGVYELSLCVKAFVSEYMTRRVNEYRYESHHQYIDIQYLISGAEKIYSLPLNSLKEVKAYSKIIDAAFYAESGEKPQELLLGNGYFAIFFPQDGHMPQLCVNNPEQVKKVVIKVKIR